MPAPTVADLLNEAVHHLQANRLPQAEAVARQILSAAPHCAPAFHVLGLVAHRTGQFAVAVDLLSRAVALEPNNAECHFHLANSYWKLARLSECVASYQTGLRLEPNRADVLNNLGNALFASGNLDAAIETFRRVLRLDPSAIYTRTNLAQALFDAYRPGEALAVTDETLRLEPDDMPAHYARAKALQALGRMGEAITEYRHAARLAPDTPAIGGALIYAMHFDADSTPLMLLEEEKRWAERFADPLTVQDTPHANIDRSPNRPLRVGFVSADFREHGVGRFLLPLFTHHDRTKIEIACYSGVATPDATTLKLKSAATLWRDTAGVSDESLAAQIRADRIDVLIDLTLHMAASRLLTFARKPAPLQATYLGYIGGSGMAAMDFRITDPYLDPPGAHDSHFREAPLYIDSYWCYPPPENAPAVAPPPVLKAGHLTFGCLNNFAKVSLAAMKTWAAILKQLPTSHLLLHAGTGDHRTAVAQFFASQGIAQDRIQFAGYQPMRDYLATYHQIDIALDPFPCPGGTTTCDALYMGVPVLTLPNQTAMSRSGVSILSQLNLQEFIASDEANYTQKTITLARDPARLADLRNSMRQRMQQSRLMNANAFARSFEMAMQRSWNRR